jgi:hypothetical protein
MAFENTKPSAANRSIAGVSMLLTLARSRSSARIRTNVGMLRGIGGHGEGHEDQDKQTVAEYRSSAFR